MTSVNNVVGFMCVIISWLRGVEPQETFHTDTDPSAYPIEYQLDSVMWHQHNGAISPLAVPAVYAALDLISASIAQLETQPAPPLSLNPDPFSTRYDFFFETVWSLAWHGDAYWLKTPTERGVDSMQVLDPDDVDVEWDDTLGRRRRTYRWQTKPVPTERISHLRFHPRPGEPEGSLRLRRLGLLGLAEPPLRSGGHRCSAHQGSPLVS